VGVGTGEVRQPRDVVRGDITSWVSTVIPVCRDGVGVITPVRCRVGVATPVTVATGGQRHRHCGHHRETLAGLRSVHSPGLLVVLVVDPLTSPSFLFGRTGSPRPSVREGP